MPTVNRIIGLSCWKGQVEMNILQIEKQIQIVSALAEGCSIRATARMVGVEHKTVMRVLLRVGEACEELLEDKIRRVRAKRVEVDEIWTFLFKKQARVSADDPQEWGDQYVFTGMDSDTKLMISYQIGKRDATTAFYLIQDLKDRLANRVQLTTDGFRPYLNAVEDNFGIDVDYAMLVKMYGSDKGEKEGPEWYGPAKVVAAMPVPVMGRPNPKWISTSYVERQNLTMRMQMRRFTRLTNAFSKKLPNLKAQVALHFAHYNFVRVHSTLRVTPAMEAGIADHIWTIKELLSFYLQTIKAA
jgi:IS1 family transposase